MVDEEARKNFNKVVAAAERMGSCDPLWLKSQEIPKFHTIELGQSGPEVVMLHGLLGAVSNWDTLLPLLSVFARAVALEFPILKAHRSEVKIKALAAYTHLFILQRAFAPAALCGNSLGGHVAMRLCLAAPEVVDCLILSGTSGLYEHTVDALPVRPDRKYLREHMQRVFKNEQFITDDRVEEIYQIVNKRMNVLNLIHAARSAKKDNLLKLLPEIKVPTLLLWGEDDEVTTMQVAETFAKHIPNSKLVSIKNCGHAPMIEHPQWFADEIQKFLKLHSRFYKTKSA